MSASTLSMVGGRSSRQPVLPTVHEMFLSDTGVASYFFQHDCSNKKRCVVHPFLVVDVAELNSANTAKQQLPY